MKNIITTLRLFITLSIITGVIYPLLITGVGRSFFAKEAGGSLVTVGDKVIGSELIGQNFKDPKYFWPRPSSIDYNPMPSGGSNLGPISADLKKAYDERKNGNNEIPQDMLFASASGLDPHVSPAAAKYQASRVAEARAFSTEQISLLNLLIDKATEKRDLGFLGDERVNVLKLNFALDSIPAH